MWCCAAVQPRHFGHVPTLPETTGNPAALKGLLGAGLLPKSPHRPQPCSQPEQSHKLLSQSNFSHNKRRRKKSAVRPVSYCGRHIRVVNGNGLWEIRGVTSIGVLLQHYCVTAAWRLELEGTDVTFGTGVAFTA